MESVRNFIAGTRAFIRVLAKDPPRTLRLASSISGLLLIIGGISGMFNIFNPLGAVISVYNILFGLLIVLTELKSWPIIRTFQKSVDYYFHLLSVPRGKGGFYMFIGFLAFFSSDWNLSRVCVLIVSIVGLVHLFACVRFGAPPEDPEAQNAGLQPAYGAPTLPPTETTWGGMLKQVLAPSPPFSLPPPLPPPSPTPPSPSHTHARARSRVRTDAPRW